MGIAAALANYYILLPLFEQFLPVEQLIASFHELMPFINSKKDIVLYNALPFNFLKGLVISVFYDVHIQKDPAAFKGHGIRRDSHD